jgi:uncharacterized protein (TIGR02453 family)
MFSEDTLNFLGDLSKNNNREWFLANKKRYEQSAKKPFLQFTEELLKKIQSDIEPDWHLKASDAIFRIHRDVRFSQDKSPYKTHLGAALSKHGRKAPDEAGYYVHLEYGRLLIGGGAYFVTKEGLDKLRRHIMQNPKALSEIIESKAFASKFGAVQGERNKRLPSEMMSIMETQPLIANKQFYYMAELPSDTIYRPDFLDFTMDYLKVGKTLNDYLGEGLS